MQRPLQGERQRDVPLPKFHREPPEPEPDTREITCIILSTYTIYMITRAPAGERERGEGDTVPSVTIRERTPTVAVDGLGRPLGSRHPVDAQLPECAAPGTRG